MNSPMLVLGDASLTIHGLMAAIGAIAGIAVTYFIAPQYRKIIVDNLLVVTIVGVIGARLTYVLIYPDQFEDFSSYFSVFGGGFVSYGGILFGSITLAVIAKVQRIKMNRLFNAVAPGFFLGLGLGRVGEIFVGEFSGIQTNSKLAHGFANIEVFNNPLFESILCFSLFLLGMYLYKVKKLSSSATLSVLIYAVVRFVIDFGRIEDKIIFKLSLGQAASLVLFIFSVILLLLNQKAQERN